MSSSSDSTVKHTGHRSSGSIGCCWGKKGNWSGVNIAAMVLGFVFFWPLGLFLVYWIISGRDAAVLPVAIKHQWAKFKRGWKGQSGNSDNSVFNEFQQTQFDRINEIREEIRDRARRFSDYRGDAKRRADEEEFNRFMADRPISNDH